MRFEKTRLLRPVCGLLLFATGCAHVDFGRVREEQAAGFREEVEARTEAIVPEEEALTLDECISIALENNLEVEKAEIERCIARLGRRTAFANFLPTLELQSNYVVFEPQPENKILGPLYTPLHDKEIRETVLQAQLPIFVPATWYLYAAHRRGEEIAELVEDYVRQMTSFQVTALYFHCVALEQSGKALESQLAAAEALEKEVGALYEEGMVLDWHAEQAEALVLSRRIALAKTERGQQQAVADLLAAMGLSPLAGLSLALDMPLEAPTGELADLAYEALLDHPRLHIADRQVAVEDNKVKIALTEFLPKLFGFASRTNSSNSFVRYPNITQTGLTGVLTLFDGLATVNEYRIARQEREKAYLAREQECFSVLVSVVRAWLNLQNAEDDLTLAAKALDIAETRLTDVELHWEEGLIKYSERLDAVAERDSAEINLTNARFQKQVVVAGLRNAIGKTYMGTDEVDTDEE